VADYDGFVYQLGTATTDGLPSGQTQSGQATAVSSTTLTDTDATWTANGLVGRYVTVWNDDQLSTAQRRKITANTTTALTVAAWDSTPTVGANYTIGGILMDFKGAFRNGSGDGSGAFYRKRIEILFLELTASVAGDECEVHVYKDLDTDTPIRSRTLSIGSGALWGTAIWGTSLWGGRAEYIPHLPQ
jgi:hypothetical protein